MNNKLIKIRNFMKTLSNEDIANSVYLYGINFDTATYERIMSALSALYKEVLTLRDMVESDFKLKEGEYHIVPKDNATKTVIIQDYCRKESALLKILSNYDVYINFINYFSKEEVEKNSPMM